MQIIQHNKQFLKKASKRTLSANLLSFIDETNQRLGFDNAQIYHLTHSNVDEYKDIIISSINVHLRKSRGIIGKDTIKELIKDVNQYYDDLHNILPISMIVFEHIYSSLTETSMLFFKEHADMLLIDSSKTTLDLSHNKNMLNHLPSYLLINESNYDVNSIIKSIGYESSSMKGIFPFVSFLLSFDKATATIHSKQFEQNQSKKLELQVRLLTSEQYKVHEINVAESLINSNDEEQIISENIQFYCGFVLNTRLIHNDVIIFNEYSRFNNDVKKTIVSYLLPFIEDFKSNYEIIDNVPVALTKEYYEYFKANIKPVIEMAKC